MSQQTLWQLASLQSRPDPAADTLAQYQALPVAHHQLEEATYLSGALGVDDVVGRAASLDPSPEVIHIDLRSPTSNSYLGGKAWSTTLWREVRSQLPPLKFLHRTPQPATIDQLLNSMRTSRWGSPRTPTSRCTPSLTLCIPPPIATLCACTILVQGHHLTTPFSPSLGTLPAPGGGRIRASRLSIPPSPRRCTSPTSPTPHSTVQVLCNGTVVPHAHPPFISSEPPLRTEPLLEPPHGVMGNPDPAPDRVGPSQPPLSFVDGNGYIVLRGLVEARDCEVGWNTVM